MKRFILTLFVFICVPAFGQYAIDTELEACHNDKNNQTTLGMVECERIALEAWDKVLNRHYRTLSDLLDKEGKDRLRSSQRKWIEYRDAEINFSNGIYYGQGGTMWNIAAAARRADITRTRALELQAYIDDLSGY